jgi:hypothetical protein
MQAPDSIPAIRPPVRTSIVLPKKLSLAHSDSTLGNTAATTTTMAL